MESQSDEIHRVFNLLFDICIGKVECMRESTIEKYLVEQVAKHGGVAEKFKSPGRNSVPDRIVSWPRTELAPAMAYTAPKVHFIEVKTLLGKVTTGQKRDHERRRKMGFTVIVIRSKADVDQYLRIYAPSS